MLKRIFDILISFFALLFLILLLLLIWLLCFFDTHSNGIFVQDRIGQYGKKFKIHKFRTIRKDESISVFGSFLRRFKIDELPQLWDVLIGKMSIVGPRPDVSGYYDLLQDEERNVLKLKPGITSLASLKYFNEEAILRQQTNPQKYNDEVIFKDKVKMNLEYYHSNSILVDLKIVYLTIVKIVSSISKKI
jgi:lipopolysaccharide/colanic/teichoic acid biosynthesis glycosyltransferase